ncbi:MAG TPA: ribonuclease H-like domain-containing protein [Terriglobia bacterium]|nr:ribonuclease H-like domain-containing protein [Terriglobia bacterium]
MSLMSLEEKLRQLRKAVDKSSSDRALEQQLETLRRLGQRRDAASSSITDITLDATWNGAPRSPCGVEECIEGRIEQHELGQFFLANQSLPFGRPYGKFRIADISSADLTPLNLFLGSATLPDPSRLIFLDTETTGLAVDGSAYAFLIGVGAIEDTQFVVRQYFLRDETDEKAALFALSKALESYEGLITFNGRIFDVPLLEARYAACCLQPPFSRLVHLDLLHPARQLWKLRLEKCHLTNLERHVLGIARDGDVPGSEIPGIYFDYLRAGDARGLQPVFFHNALDVVSLAALTVEVAEILQSAREGNRSLPGLDLFSLSRIFERVGAVELSASICDQALSAGLPEALEPRALWHLARQHKRLRRFDAAAEIWLNLARRETPYALDAYRELVIHYERRQRDAQTALQFTDAALALLHSGSFPSSKDEASARHLERFMRRRQRLQKRLNAAKTG